MRRVASDLKNRQKVEILALCFVRREGAGRKSRSWGLILDGTDLVAETLRSNNGDFIADTLVGLEVEGEFGVVAFDDDFGRLLNGLIKTVSVRVLKCSYVEG